MAISRLFDEDIREQALDYADDLFDQLAMMEKLILNLTSGREFLQSRESLFRMTHSIKGAAAGYGLELISLVAHQMEDALALSRKQNHADEELLERLLQKRDQLESILRAYKSEEIKKIAEFKEQLSRLKTTSAGESKAQEVANCHVLIVESSGLVVDSVARQLSGYGCEFATAKNGYDGLGRLLKEKYSFLITGNHLPIIEGVDLIKTLRTLPGPNKDIPAFCITTSRRPLILGDANYYQVTKDMNMGSRIVDVMDRLKLKQKVVAANIADVVGMQNVALRILVIDDAPEIHALLRLAFKKYSQIKLHFETDPTRAQGAVAEFNPDVILLDVNMPQMSGFEVYEQLKKSSLIKNIQVYFLTGSDDETMSNNNTADAAGILKKPFLPKSFATEFLNKALKKKAVA